jgi:uncharacterized protein with HEPN domain
MPKRDLEFFIIDMLVAINTIQRKTKSIETSESLLQNEDAWLSTTRSLEIIGEAMKTVLDCKQLNQEYINPEWRDVVDFRNIIIHEYFGLNIELIFDIIKNSINSLEEELILLLKKLTRPKIILTAIDLAIIDLQKARRGESIEYLKTVKKALLS